MGWARRAHIAQLVVVALLGWQVVTGGPLLQGDRQARAWVLGHQVPALRVAATVVTVLGNARYVFPVLLVLCAALAWRRRSWELLITAAVAAAIVAVAVLTLKAGVHRPGPDPLQQPAHGGAWPSGHTLTAAVALSVVLQLAPATTPDRARYRWWAAYAVTAAVAAAMVYRNYHWVSDVVASLLLSDVLLTLSWASARALQPNPPSRPTCQEASRARTEHLGSATTRNRMAAQQGLEEAVAACSVR